MTATGGITRALAALAVLGVVATGCTPGPQIVVPKSPTGPAIATVTLSISNVHVVLGDRPLLVDTGAPEELGELEKGLGTLGVRLADVKCAVITHVHADHAGGARALQERGITIIAGAGDLARAQRGDHGTLVPTSVFAQVLAWFLPATYAPFTPNVLVEVGGTRDLADCGVVGQVVSMPGHTAGSLVVIVNGGKTALVGDLFRGGALGGVIQRRSPKEHFYQDDLGLDHKRIHELLSRGVETFVLGHGGPSRRSDVADEFGATD